MMADHIGGKLLTSDEQGSGDAGAGREMLIMKRQLGLEDNLVKPVFDKSLVSIAHNDLCVFRKRYPSFYQGSED